ncbi:MAG: RidA family protein [Bacteroidota bacterium]
MKIIQHAEMPHSNGHYSQCIEHNGLLYLSGQLPIQAADRSIPEGIAAQTELALANVERILLAAGSNRNKVLQMRIYISDISLWDQVNAVYADFFKEHKPARSIVPTRELHFGCLIEIEATAIQ